MQKTTASQRAGTIRFQERQLQYATMSKSHEDERSHHEPPEYSSTLLAHRRDSAIAISIGGGHSEGSPLMGRVSVARSKER